MARPKPITIQRQGRNWIVYDKNVVVTKGKNDRPSLPDRANFTDGPIFKFKTRDDAVSLAHQLGKYLRNYGGDFVDAYTTVVDEDGNILKG